MTITSEKAEVSQDAWEMALQQLDSVARLLHLEPGMHDLLRHPKRELTVHFPVRMDDGSCGSSPGTASSTT